MKRLEICVSISTFWKGGSGNGEAEKYIFNLTILANPISAFGKGESEKELSGPHDLIDQIKPDPCFEMI